MYTSQRTYRTRTNPATPGAPDVAHHMTKDYSQADIRHEAQIQEAKRLLKKERKEAALNIIKGVHERTKEHWRKNWKGNTLWGKTRCVGEGLLRYTMLYPASVMGAGVSLTAREIGGMFYKGGVNKYLKEGTQENRELKEKVQHEFEEFGEVYDELTHPEYQTKTRERINMLDGKNTDAVLLDMNSAISTTNPYLTEAQMSARGGPALDPLIGMIYDNNSRIPEGLPAVYGTPTTANYRNIFTHVKNEFDSFAYFLKKKGLDLHKSGGLRDRIQKEVIDQYAKAWYVRMKREMYAVRGLVPPPVVSYEDVQSWKDATGLYTAEDERMVQSAVHHRMTSALHANSIEELIADEDDYCTTANNALRQGSADPENKVISGYRTVRQLLGIYLKERIKQKEEQLFAYSAAAHNIEVRFDSATKQPCLILDQDGLIQRLDVVYDDLQERFVIKAKGDRTIPLPAPEKSMGFGGTGSLTQQLHSLIQTHGNEVSTVADLFETTTSERLPNKSHIREQHPDEEQYNEANFSHTFIEKCTRLVHQSPDLCIMKDTMDGTTYLVKKGEGDAYKRIALRENGDRLQAIHPQYSSFTLENFSFDHLPLALHSKSKKGEVIVKALFGDVPDEPIPATMHPFAGANLVDANTPPGINFIVYKNLHKFTQTFPDFDVAFLNPPHSWPTGGDPLGTPATQTAMILIDRSLGSGNYRYLQVTSDPRTGDLFLYNYISGKQDRIFPDGELSKSKQRMYDKLRGTPPYTIQPTTPVQGIFQSPYMHPSFYTAVRPFPWPLNQDEMLRLHSHVQPQVEYDAYKEDAFEEELNYHEQKDKVDFLNYIQQFGMNSSGLLMSNKRLSYGQLRAKFTFRELGRDVLNNYMHLLAPSVSAVSGAISTLAYGAGAVLGPSGLVGATVVSHGVQSVAKAYDPKHIKENIVDYLARQVDIYGNANLSDNFGTGPNDAPSVGNMDYRTQLERLTGKPEVSATEIKQVFSLLPERGLQDVVRKLEAQLRLLGDRLQGRVGLKSDSGLRDFYTIASLSWHAKNVLRRYRINARLGELNKEEDRNTQTREERMQDLDEQLFFADETAQENENDERFQTLDEAYGDQQLAQLRRTVASRNFWDANKFVKKALPNMAAYALGIGFAEQINQAVVPYAERYAESWTTTGFMASEVSRIFNERILENIPKVGAYVPYLNRWWPFRNHVFPN